MNRRKMLLSYYSQQNELCSFMFAIMVIMLTIK